jgi:hypothetical protein
MFRKFRSESVFDAAGLEAVEYADDPMFLSMDDTETASSSKTGIGNKEGSGAFRNALEEKCDSLVGSLFLVPLLGVCSPLGGFVFPFF